MESITIKVDEQMAKAIEQSMKPLYATKTEFIREAIRDKIKKQEREAFLKKNLGKYGSLSDLDDETLRVEGLKRFIERRH